MSIVHDKAIFRLPLASALKDTPHLHEGKFATVTSGEITVPATASATVVGVISDPDSHITAMVGNDTSADLIGLGFGGVVRVQLDATPGTFVAHTTLLQLGANGCVKAYSSGTGAIIVGRAAESCTGTQYGLLAATLLTPYTT